MIDILFFVHLALLPLRHKKIQKCLTGISLSKVGQDKSHIFHISMKTYDEVRPLDDLRVCNQIVCFFYFSTKMYVVGTQKNHLIQTVLLSAQNMLKLMGKEIFTILC